MHVVYILKSACASSVLTARSATRNICESVQTCLYVRVRLSPVNAISPRARTSPISKTAIYPAFHVYCYFYPIWNIAKHVDGPGIIGAPISSFLFVFKRQIRRIIPNYVSYQEFYVELLYMVHINFATQIKKNYRFIFIFKNQWKLIIILLLCFYHNSIIQSSFCPIQFYTSSSLISRPKSNGIKINSPYPYIAPPIYQVY